MLILTPQQAIDLLPEGERIHTFLGFIGADWDREAVIEALNTARRVSTADGFARSLGHGISLVDRTGRTYFIATDEQKLRALELEQDTDA